MKFTAHINDAVLSRTFGFRAAIAVLAAIVNDLGFKLALTVDAQMNPRRTKETPKRVNFPGMDSMSEPPPADPNVLSLGFTAAQILLLDTIRQPDPDFLGSTNAWATRYMRDGAMLVQNLVDWRAKKEADRLTGERAKLRDAGFVIPDTSFTAKLSNEEETGRADMAKALDQLIAMHYAAIKDSTPEELWAEVEGAYHDESQMALKVRTALHAILGAQSKRLIENSGFVSVDAGIVSLSKLLTPTAPTPTTGS